MAQMPTLGRSRKRRPFPYALVGIILSFAVAFVAWRMTHKKPAPATTSQTQTATTATSQTPPKTPPLAPPTAEDAGSPELPKKAVSKAEEALAQAGYKRLRVDIAGPLETAIVGQVGVDVGQRLVQVVVRSLVWWLAVPSELFRGDHLDALYEEHPGEDPIVVALRYRSTKHPGAYRAYRFKSSGASFARMYLPEGQELELRLVHTPLDDYEQVTSRLRDGRGHKGVDFKTPLGSPVKAPFDATVARKNWNWRGNGNSVELHQSGGHGYTALFLHLQEPVTLSVGVHVSRGQTVGKSGNTGHSFAPHLHFQLMSGEKVLDPFVVEETTRRKLGENDRAAFTKEVARLDHLLDLP
jgi:xanthosine utilization system XapX-like protein